MENRCLFLTHVHATGMQLNLGQRFVTLKQPFNTFFKKSLL